VGGKKLQQNKNGRNCADLIEEAGGKVLGGTTRRKKLLSPKSMDVRPMMEVVKGAAFGILQFVMTILIDLLYVLLSVHFSSEGNKKRERNGHEQYCGVSKERTLEPGCVITLKRLNNIVEGLFAKVLADEEKAKAIAFDEINKSPEENKRRLTVETLRYLFRVISFLLMLFFSFVI
ncbi:hypothetical protein Tco_1276045, partial [Tanacetum coccineum]